MKVTTAMNHRDRLLSHVKDAFWFARTCGYTHEKLGESIRARVYSDPAWKKIPSWASVSVSARIFDEFDRMYTPVLSAARLEGLLAGKLKQPVEYVRWQLRLDGEHVTSDQICKLRAAGDEDVHQRVEGAHIWNHKPDQTYSDGGWRFLNKRETI